MPKKSSMKIISVGGSIIIPDGGFNIPFLKKFRSMILRDVAVGMKFVLVIGGGAPAREYQEAAEAVTPMTEQDLDHIGLHMTRMNAQMVRFLFKNFAYKEVIIDPTKKVKTTKPIIIGAGWKPGFSTDNVAVEHAKTYGADEVINLSNISYVYDKDPNKYKNAQKIVDIDWKTFREKIVGDDWEAGMSAPFDPIASRTAEKLGLTVSLVKGTQLAQVAKALKQQQFQGTVIHP